MGDLELELHVGKLFGISENVRRDSSHFHLYDTLVNLLNTLLGCGIASFGFGYKLTLPCDACVACGVQLLHLVLELSDTRVVVCRNRDRCRNTDEG
jgi:hypothetical protein